MGFPACPRPTRRPSQNFNRAVNSIPSRARIEIDVRDIDQPRRDAVLEKIAAACEEVAARRQVAISREVVNADPPAQCAPAVVDALTQACAAHGLSYERMVSRAYHDSLFLPRIAPTAMLFIPSRGGISHRPDEYSSPDAIAQGSLVLAETLAHLAK